jgi:DNA-binding transcriptional LysR family regulator
VIALPPASRESDWRDALRHQPFIRYDRTSFGGRLVDQFLRRNRITVNESLELDELDGIMGAVEAGIGVALVPQTHTHRRGRFDVRTLPLDAPSFVREIGVIALRRGEREPAVRMLADALDVIASSLDARR